MIQFIRHFVGTVLGFLEVPDFIKVHKLWKGFWEHKIVAITLMLAGVLFSWHMLSMISNWWDHLDVKDPLQAGIQAGFLVKDLAFGGYEFMFAGAYKYVILIIMELLIFHMTLSTHAAINGKKDPLTPGIFVRAQIRMIKVSVFTFTMEMIVSVLVKTALGILGYEAVQGILLFLIQCFFLGFAMIDNYNEIHHLDIKKSYHHTLNYIGVAVAIGLILYILILIPVIGPFAGPLLGAITATLVMHKLETDQVDRSFI